MVIAGLSAWAGSDPTVIPAYMGKNIYQGNLTLVDKQIIRALSALGTVTAMAYCRFTQRAFTPANPSGSFIENMLVMMDFVNQVTGKPDPKHIDCLERLWVLYADHELTNSTAAFLHVASTLADPYTCSIAGIAAAYGPLHGGAIDTAFKTIQDVGKPENVPKLIEDVKAKKFRLFGYGHRIYKTVDPRSVFIRESVCNLFLSYLTCRAEHCPGFWTNSKKVQMTASWPWLWKSTDLHPKTNISLLDSYMPMLICTEVSYTLHCKRPQSVMSLITMADQLSLGASRPKLSCRSRWFREAQESWHIGGRLWVSGFRCLFRCEV